MSKREGTVKVNVPGTPKGETVEVPGLGLFKNGSSRKVNEAEIAQFEALGYQFPKNGELNVPLSTEELAKKPDAEEAPETEQPAIDETKKGGGR